MTAAAGEEKQLESFVAGVNESGFLTGPHLLFRLTDLISNWVAVRARLNADRVRRRNRGTGYMRLRPLTVIPYILVRQLYTGTAFRGRRFFGAGRDGKPQSRKHDAQRD